MIIVDHTIVSDDLYLVRFACHLPRCLGSCCVGGDAGAPLEEGEISVMEDYLEDIIPHMTEGGIRTVREGGVFDYDVHGHFVTPLINDGECAFTNFENGIAYCAIERAHERGVIPFKKPVSCHLYPVRVSKYNEFDAVNYHKWNICKPALKKGKKEGLPLYRFLKKALIRKFGMEWYQRLEAAISERLDQ